jgi:hypothetical protein
VQLQVQLGLVLLLVVGSLYEEQHLRASVRLVSDLCW